MNFKFLELQQLAFTHINVRNELHGEEMVTAVDMSMRLEGSNDMLDWLHPDLRAMHYKNAAFEQGQVELPDQAIPLPNLRMPKLNAQKFKWAPGQKFKGYTCEIDYGLGPGESNVTFDDCTLSNFQFECKEGGTVILTWLIQYSGQALTTHVRGLLTGLTGKDIFILLEPPKYPDPAEGGDAVKPAKQKKKPKPTQPDATDIFAGRKPGEEGADDEGKEDQDGDGPTDGSDVYAGESHTE